jgi:tRNA (cytidine/uridine-2'-O-)-methyltransferase
VTIPIPGGGDGSAAVPPLEVVLHQPEIAENAGAIGRTCVALGARLWLVRPLGFRLDDRRVRRAGLDYWEHLDWRVVDRLEEAAGGLDPGRAWSLWDGGARPLWEAAFAPGDVLVFGAESRGLPPAWLERAERAGRCLRIPHRPEARCLNLASAVAVAGFEAARQLGRGGPSWPGGLGDRGRAE